MHDPLLMPDREASLPSRKTAPDRAGILILTEDQIRAELAVFEWSDVEVGGDRNRLIGVQEPLQQNESPVDPTDGQSSEPEVSEITVAHASNELGKACDEILESHHVIRVIHHPGSMTRSFEKARSRTRSVDCGRA